MQDRGLAAYISELLGTLFLVMIIGVVVTLFNQTDPASGTGSDFAVIGLVHAFGLFALIMTFGAVSGGHFNPAVTIAAAIQKRIDLVDAVVYILAQLSGGILGSLLVKAILLDEGSLSGYGNPEVADAIGNNLHGFVVEGLGTFLLVLVICAVALNPRARQEWAPLAIGATLGFVVMIFGPLTGGSFNPARWFGPALIGDGLEASDLVPYVLGPLAGALLATAVYKFVIAGPQFAEGPEPPTSDARAVGQAVKDAETRVRNKDTDKDRDQGKKPPPPPSSRR
ncbi:MAG: aquaporin [Actinomycetota bacterium]|nr:aquaporin [Actinomycetota bacterium]